MADRRRYPEDYDGRDARSGRDRRGPDPRDARRDREREERLDTRAPRYEPTVQNARPDPSRASGRQDIGSQRGGIDPRIPTRGGDIQMEDADPRDRMNIPATVEYREYQDRNGRIIREEIPRPSYRDDRDRDDVPSSRRIIDYDTRDAGRPGGGDAYNDYFLPGEGIQREVIQHEICRYLGQDATVRPFQMSDGRRGFMIRAYRALTTAMIASLKDDTLRFEAERRQKDQQGRGPVAYRDSNTLHIRERQEQLEARYRGQMDIDDDYHDPPPPRAVYGGREPESRLPPQATRHGPSMPTTGYPPDPPYASYAVAPSQGIYDSIDPMRQQPRSGFTPPPIGRGVQPPYQSGTYPANTGAVRPSLPGAYTDPRTGQVVQAYPLGGGYPPAEPPSRSGYPPPEPPSRHSRR